MWITSPPAPRLVHTPPGRAHAEGENFSSCSFLSLSLSHLVLIQRFLSFKLLHNASFSIGILFTIFLLIIIIKHRKPNILCKTRELKRYYKVHVLNQHWFPPRGRSKCLLPFHSGIHDLRTEASSAPCFGFPIRAKCLGLPVHTDKQTAIARYQKTVCSKFNN